MKTDTQAPPDELIALAIATFPGQPEAMRLVQIFWPGRRAYQRSLARTLADIARGCRAHDWQVRCLAAMMLQHQWTCLPAAQVQEHAYLLCELGLKKTPDPFGSVEDFVLSEGHTTTQLNPFLREFRCRLARRASLHRELRREKPLLHAWQTLFLLSREECTIELGRYLFTAREVAEHVVSALRVSKGSPVPHQTPLIASEAAATLARWPPFERAIAEAIISNRAVYWSRADTSRRLNSLVSRPLGTVVVVVKPPGSRLELEIKRTGKGDGLPLGVAYERSGWRVPQSHRLDGGSMTLSLRFEAAAAARYSALFRAVWSRAAPIATVLSMRFIDTLPAGDRAEHILDYFANENVFAEQFLAMRAALMQCVETFEYEGSSGLPELNNELGLTVRFLHYTAPGQSILAGTSKFRLSVVAQFLDEAGAESYFREVAGTPAPPDEARRFADVVLEEVLGVYHPPRCPYRSHADYLDMAFAERRNRVRADRTFCSLMRDLGTFWGTMLAVCGHSFGESLVARNVGISTSWCGGRWQVSLVFMDHDNFHLPTPEFDEFHSHFILDGTAEDWNYAIGDSRLREQPVSLVDFLRKIYRVTLDVSSRGDIELRRELRRAYRQTRRALTQKPELRGLFTPAFLKASLALEHKIRRHLEGMVPVPPGPDSQGITIAPATAGPSHRLEHGLVDRELQGYENIISKLFGLLHVKRRGKIRSAQGS